EVVGQVAHQRRPPVHEAPGDELDIVADEEPPEGDRGEDDQHRDGEDEFHRQAHARSHFKTTALSSTGPGMVMPMARATFRLTERVTFRGSVMGSEDGGCPASTCAACSPHWSPTSL